jgi:hypothetical protein
MDEHTEAWLAVAKVLQEVAPGYLDGCGNGIECAVKAIRQLATPSPGKAPSELIAEIEAEPGGKERIAAARERVRSLLASPGKAEAERWQPIETAPRDREIWAFNGEQGRMQWSEGSADNGEGWALWVWCDQLLSDADPDPEQPTHWMPLPAAPDAIQQERDKQ